MKKHKVAIMNTDHKRKKLLLDLLCRDEEILTNNIISSSLVSSIQSLIKRRDHVLSTTATVLSVAESNLDDDVGCKFKFTKVLEGFCETIGSLNDEDFFNYFKVNKSTFEIIHKIIAKNYENERGIDPRSCLYVALYNLGHNVTLKEVSKLFGIKACTALGCLQRVINILCKVSSQYLKWPQENMDEVIENFKEQYGLPKICGILGSCLIQIQSTVAAQKHEYLDSNNKYSVNMFACCDNRQVFTYVHSGIPGSKMGQEVFQYTDLYYQLSNHPNSLLYDTQHHLISNRAFALSEQILTPYSGFGQLSYCQKSYNHKLSQAQGFFEDTLEALMVRFRKIQFLSCRPERASTIITACCVLHNIAVLNDDKITPSVGQEFSPYIVDDETGFMKDSKEGCEMRDSYANKIMLKMNTLSEIIALEGDSEFFQRMRIHKKAFYVLAELVEKEFVMTHRGGFKPIDPLTSLSITLWYLGTNCNLKEIKSQYGMAASSVLRCIQKVLAILSNNASKYIKWPSFEELHIIENGFRNVTGLPGICGVAGTCLNEVKATKQLPMEYKDRNHKMSINLFAICDQNMQFTYVEAGHPGSAEGNHVFANTQFYNQMMTNPEVLFPSDEHYIVADGTFALSKHVLTPYKDYGYATPYQVAYNRKVALAHTTITNAFTILKSRFRKLQLLYSELGKATEIIKACCVIHNIALRHPEAETFELNEDFCLQMPTEANTTGCLYDTLDGIKKRDYVASNLF